MVNLDPSPFEGPQHTVLAVYLVGVCVALTVTYDSTHGIVQRYHINKKWYFLFGATCLFAYLYVRPLIRKRLGSASRSYINWGSVYIAWLCSAVFYHLPSLESMGLDVKADISLLLTIFLLSLAILGLLQAVYGLAVLFKLIDPWLHSPSGTAKEAWSIVVLNSMTLALACSTYYSFCGNAATVTAALGSGQSVRDLVCNKWLPPVTTSQHPAFSSWVLYGEPIGAAVGGSNATASCSVGDWSRNWSSSAGCAAGGSAQLGNGGTAAVGHAISPVFTMWLTLMMMFGVNCLADYQVAAVISSAQNRQMLTAEMMRARAAARHSMRRRSADYAHDLGRINSGLHHRSSMKDLLNAVCDTLPTNIWRPTTGALRAASTKLLSWRDDSLVGLAALAREYTGRWPVPQQEPKLVIPYDALQPSFLPMFPWYSGTSADLLKTLFDLLISVKLFLGRFDMRTMQVATGIMGIGPDPTPQDGDGFTYEHLAQKEELWFDFCADTGDGGDPTYAVARCMAAPQLQVVVPEELTAEKGVGAVVKTLPRAQLLVHGGDLAYPNPTDETYEMRLFKPYEAALPPPSHVHPGHLVVNKPDLPPQYWASSAPTGCKCVVVPHCGVLAGAEQQQLCKLCQKAEALRAYEGPSCFMLPGNHDWIDGLETFQRHVQHKGWIGGWLLPQEKSYFALHLPHGWWLFGIDLALVDDIDMCQYRYFARVAEERMGPEDQAILTMHCPTWLMDWFWGTQKCRNLRQLVRGPLRGRARMSIAGDLHFFMRHSFTPASGPPHSLTPSPAPSGISTPQGSSPRGASPTSSRAPTPTPSLRSYMSPSQLHQTLMAKLTGAGGSATGASGGGVGGATTTSKLAPLQQQTGWPGVGQGTVTQTAQQEQAMAAQQAQQQPRTPPVPVQQPMGQQQQQQLVFGRPMEMEYVPGGTSPTGSSPIAGSPTLPSMLLDAEDNPWRRQSQQRSGGRWSAAANLAAKAIGRARGRVSDTVTGSGTADGQLGASASVVGIPSSPSVGVWMEPGFGGVRPSSAPVAMGAGRQKATLPILSPVHGSQMELGGLEVDSSMGGEEGEGSLSAPALVHQGGLFLATGSSSAPSLDEAAAAGPAQPPPLSSKDSASEHAMKHHDSAPGVLELSSPFSLGSSPPGKHAAPAGSSAASSVAGSVSGMSAFGNWWPGLRPKARINGGGVDMVGAGGSKRLEGDSPAVLGDDEDGSGVGWHLNDPEHLVVSGSGGGFLHPTHVFSYSRFRPVHDPAAGSVLLKASARGKAGDGSGGGMRRRTPSSSSLYSLSHRDDEETAGTAAGTERPFVGEYHCDRAFPTPEDSLRLGRRNLHMFRVTNNRFDIIGGMLYFLLVVSVLPKCSGIAEILDSGNIIEGIGLFVKAHWDTVSTIVLESYISVAVLCLLWLMCLGFARSGGVGAMEGLAPSLHRRPEFQGSSMAVRARIGGVATQLLYATAHCVAHFTAAVSLLLLLELGIETVMRYESMGREGYHSLYKWYRHFEALHFPDPMGLRLVLESWTLGLYPNGIKWLMAVFDVPEAICVSRTALCAAGGRLARLTRIQAAGFYLGVLAYYWLLATPAVGFLFGCYLYLSVNLFHVHYDEAFSSLQVPHFKGFCRFHITRNGDLEMYSLGLDRVPFSWREDPRWRTPQGGGSRDNPSHKVKYPSRWLPVEEEKLLARGGRRAGGLRVTPPPETSLKVVDYLVVPQYRHEEQTVPPAPSR